MGRPSKYTPEIQAKAYEYLDNLPEDEVIHSAEGLADYLNISRATVYKWRDEIEEFSDTVEAVIRKQGKALINRGLTGEFSAPITRMMMNVNHGYRERSEVDNLSTDGSMTPKSIERLIIKAENI